MLNIWNAACYGAIGILRSVKGNMDLRNDGESFDNEPITDADWLFILSAYLRCRRAVKEPRPI